MLSAEKPSIQPEKGRGIETIELTQTHQCMGTRTTEQGTQELVRFRYDSTNSSVRALMKPEVMGGRGREIGERFEDLGVDNIGFSVYTRRSQRVEETGTKTLENPANVYVLLHGWTANRDIFSDVENPNQLSVVETLMAEDPEAVIITMDGNGFGETTFREDVVQDRTLLAQKCHPEQYATQVDFLVKNVLGLEPEDVAIAGHSMGGAAAVKLSSMGYGGCLALAPAAFPTNKALTQAKQIQKEQEESLTEKLKHLGGPNLSTLIYKALGTAVEVGAKVSELGTALEGVSSKTVEQIFNLIGPYLMGKEVTGSSELDLEIITELQKIHAKELTADKLKTVSAAILQLSKGMDFDELGNNSENLVVMHGKKDTLVQPQDLEATVATILTKALHSTQGNLESPSVQKAHNLWEQLQDASLTSAGGHYSPVYSRGLAQKLHELHPHNT